VYDVEVTEPSSTTSTTVASGAATATTAVTRSDALARTGSRSGDTLAIALVCIGLGTLLTVVATRRRAVH
jgi:hypothetical protein